jgi:hypothetical protein
MQCSCTLIAVIGPKVYSDYFLQLENIKLELQVIVNWKVTMNSFSGLVHRAVTVAFRVTYRGRSALIAVIQARGASVSCRRRAGTVLSLLRDYSTGTALALALVLRQREMCVDSATWDDAWCGELYRETMKSK